MTAPITQRLCETGAALAEDRVSMQTLAQANGTAAYGTLLRLMAGPCLLPVPGVGTVLGFGMVFRDGVAVVLGLVAAGLALFDTTDLMLMT